MTALLEPGGGGGVRIGERTRGGGGDAARAENCLAKCNVNTSRPGGRSACRQDKMTDAQCEIISARVVSVPVCVSVCH